MWAEEGWAGGCWKPALQAAVVVVVAAGAGTEAGGAAAGAEAAVVDAGALAISTFGSAGWAVDDGWAPAVLPQG